MSSLGITQEEKDYLIEHVIDAYAAEEKDARKALVDKTADYFATERLGGVKDTLGYVVPHIRTVSIYQCVGLPPHLHRLCGS